jgi:hypothetical protein
LNKNCYPGFVAALRFIPLQILINGNSLIKLIAVAKKKEPFGSTAVAQSVRYLPGSRLELASKLTSDPTAIDGCGIKRPMKPPMSRKKTAQEEH